MATNLSFVSLVQRNRHPSHGTWIWNTKQISSSQSQDPFYNSWEVRAFAEDPPRLYTCKFCRRKFQSMQALGGHMNMHRRDRARHGQTPPAGVMHPSPSTIHNISNRGGLRVLYQFPGPNCIVPNPDSSSTHLLSNNPNQEETPMPTSMPFKPNDEASPTNTKEPTATGELDLELRL